MIRRVILKSIVFISIIFLGASSASFATAMKKAEPDPEYINGNLLVKTENPEELEEYGEVKEIINDYYILTTENAETAEEVAEALEEKSEVEAVVPDLEIEPAAISSASYYSWGTEATGSDHYTDWLNFGSERGGKQNNRVLVAVFDSGIDDTHEAFTTSSGESRICPEASPLSRYYKDGSVYSSDVTDTDGHGTATAGIIAQATPTDVCIVPIKVFSGDSGTLSDVFAAMRDIAYAVDVINMSLSTKVTIPTAQKESYNEIIKDLISDYNLTLVASAGNSGAESGMEDIVGYPAVDANVIAVSALKKNESGGYEFDSSYSQYGPEIDFSMPGTSVTVPYVFDGYSNQYATASGTSFAAPHLAAAAALLRADSDYNYTGTTSFLNVEDVYQGLRENATYLGDYSTGYMWDKYYGYGMVDFGANMFTPGRISANTILSEDSTSAIISGYALGVKNITAYAVTSSEEPPSSWTDTFDRNFSYGSSYVIDNIEQTVTENGTYYVWIRDEELNTIYEAVTVSGITETEEEEGDDDEDEDQLIQDGVYTISSALNSSKVIDIAGAGSGNGANAQIYNSNNTVAQKFIFRHIEDNIYEIENLKSAKVLDVAGASMKNGANVQQYTSNSTCAQRWKIAKTEDEYLTFASTCNTSYVLDVAGGSMSNGANLQIYTSNSTKAQKFSLNQVTLAPTSELLTDGTYKITSKLNSDMVLDIAGASRKNGGNLQLYTSNDTNAQKFTITYLKDGFYKITNYGSNLALDVAGAGTNNGTNVQQYGWNGTIAQQWLIVKNDDDSYSFISRCNGLYLDIAGASTKNGANVQIYTGNSTNAQKFYLSAV